MGKESMGEIIARANEQLLAKEAKEAAEGREPKSEKRKESEQAMIARVGHESSERRAREAAEGRYPEPKKEKPSMQEIIAEAGRTSEQRNAERIQKIEKARESRKPSAWEILEERRVQMDRDRAEGRYPEPKKEKPSMQQIIAEIGEQKRAEEREQERVEAAKKAGEGSEELPIPEKKSVISRIVARFQEFAGIEQKVKQNPEAGQGETLKEEKKPEEGNEK